MKRIVLLTALAAMMAAAMALSGVAQAKSPIGNKADAKCLAEASKTLQPGFNHADYNFVGGTEGSDSRFQTTAGPDVFCGFGGDDEVGVLQAGDIFLGGAGNDRVHDDNFGTFYGGEGDDRVGDDNEPSATFYGGAGNDRVDSNNLGTFNGGEGDDFVQINHGIFYGEEGIDTVGGGAGPVDGP